MKSHATLIAKSIDIHGDSNFTQGCAFSPDGLCILTCTAADNTLRLYNTPQQQQSVVSSFDDNDEEEGRSKEVPNNNNSISREDEVNGKAFDSSSVVPWRTSLSASEGESVRSYSWYPLMNSYEPATCAYISASRDQPIHLLDAYTSAIRASYRPYNALDEMESPAVVTFTPDGSRIFASGFKTDRTIHIFDTNSPGRDSDILRLGKTRRSTDGQKGIVSSLSFPTTTTTTNNSGGRSNVFAVGTYSPGSIYVYDDRMPSGGNPAGTVLHDGMCIVGHGKRFANKKTNKRRLFVDMDGTSDDTSKNEDGNGTMMDEMFFSAAKSNWYQSRARGGITQLAWSTVDTNTLYSASRRSDAVIAWDMRMLTGTTTSHPVRGIMAYGRDGDTNQRLEFELDDDNSRLFVTSRDNSVKVYHSTDGTLLWSIDGLDDVANGVSYCGESSQGNLAIAIGARRFDIDSYEEDGSEKDVGASRDPGSLELYLVSNPTNGT